MQKNRGMYIEELVNKTISYYETNNICHIEKRNLPIKIVSKKETKIEGHLNKKSFTDFARLTCEVQHSEKKSVHFICFVCKCSPIKR